MASSDSEIGFFDARTTGRASAHELTVASASERVLDLERACPEQAETRGVNGLVAAAQVLQDQLPSSSTGGFARLRTGTVDPESLQRGVP
jgi:hypothetical protein